MNDTQTVRKAYAQTPSGQIHYAEAGEGPPLILLSETARTHRHFRRLMPMLSPYFRTIALDTPGYGNSHPLPDPLSIEALAACIAAFIEAIGLEKSHVFGVNLGNKIASAFAAKFPNRVDHLVLAGYTHSIIPDHGARNTAIKPIVDGYAGPRSVLPDGSHLVRQWLRTFKTAADMWWPERLLTSTDVRPEEIENIEARVSDYLLGWRSVDPVYRAVYEYDLAQAYREIKAPTLIIELVTPQEEHLGPQADKVVAMLSSGAAAVVPVPGVDATTPITQASAMEAAAEGVAKAVIPFLAGQDMAAA